MTSRPPVLTWQSNMPNKVLKPTSTPPFRYDLWGLGAARTRAAWGQVLPLTL